MRVWEPFLTEQDRALLAADVRPRQPVGFGGRVAVLLIDNYRAQVGDERLPLLESVHRWPSSTGLAGWDALDQIEVLLAHARDAGVPVVHVTGWDLESVGLPTGSVHHRAPTDAPTPEVMSRHDRKFDIVEQAAPHEGELVFRKIAPSAFWNTPLIVYLRLQNIETLVVAGSTTSGCVRATVEDSAAYRFRTIVVEDCVYDRLEAAHAMSLFDMHHRWADVLPLDDVLPHLAAHGSAAR